ncbi:hypothetical protein OH77DRAFT_1432607, partial [Trametes cingulata]
MRPRSCTRGWTASTEIVSIHRQGATYVEQHRYQIIDASSQASLRGWSRGGRENARRASRCGKPPAEAVCASSIGLPAWSPVGRGVRVQKLRHPLGKARHRTAFPLARGSLAMNL